MDGTQAELFATGKPEQGDLFGADTVQRQQFVPKREHVIQPLMEMLAAMRAAQSWPWDEVQMDLKRNHVWPHLLGHLTAEEAALWRADLEAEAARLDSTAL